MNKNLLRSLMILYGDTNRTLAEYLGISERSVSDKINENGTEFKQCEISLIIDRYHLDAQQIKEVFFNH